MTSTSFFLRFVAVILATASHVLAQTCPPQWQPGTPSRLLSGNVDVLRTFDPDGTGPLGAWLIAGGSGIGLRGGPTAPLHAFDGTTWRSITGDQSPQPGVVKALTVYNGELIAAGSFSSIGGVAANNIARWDGTTWRPLAQGVSDSIQALEVHAGSLFVGGSFQTVGPGISSPGVARWNGSVWSAVSSSLSTNATVYALRSFRNNLYAGGNFTSLGGVNATSLAVWNNTSWAAFGQPNGTVRDLDAFTGLAITQDRLFIAGDFSTINAQSIGRFAIWNPSAGTWATAGTPPAGLLEEFIVRPSGISSYQLSAIFGGRLFSLISGTWTLIGDTTLPGNSFGTALAIYNGQWAIGRTDQEFDASVKLLNNNVWTNTAGPGAPGYLTVVADAGGGAVIATALMPATQTTSALNIVVRREPNADTWTQLGGIFANANNNNPTSMVYALASMPNGDVVAGGVFTSIGGVSRSYIARWDGTSWNAMGSNSNFVVYDLLPMPNGDLYAATVGGMMRWDGSAWTSVGVGIAGTDTFGYRLAKHPSGDVILAGRFATVNNGGIVNNIARWNGTNWAPIGSGLPLQSDEFVASIAVASDGRIAACVNRRSSTSPGRSTIYFWDNTFWRVIATQLPPSLAAPVYAVEFLPDGDLVVMGIFESFQSTPANSIARWNGSWSAFSPEGITRRDIFGSMIPGSGFVEDATLLSTGDLVVGGDFTQVDNLVSTHFARATLPTLCGCDDIDFNNNEAFPEDQDVIDFFNVLAGGSCSAGNTCNDIDFNNNEAFPEDQDVIDFFNVLAGGTC
jgi:hypothetical protein